MRIEQLFYFSEVAKIGSINSAAEKLHISQQSLNSTMKNMERELGHQLFTTSNKGISLTNQGELVLEAAQDIVARYHLLENDMAHTVSSNRITASIKLQATPLMMDYFVSNVLQPFSKLHPDIRVDLSVNDHQQILCDLANGTSDIAVMGLQFGLVDKIFPEYRKTKTTTFNLLYQYKISVVASSQLPISRYKSISMKTLLKYPLVVYTTSKPEDDLTFRWLKLSGNPDIRYTTSSSRLYYEILQNGQAVGLSTNDKRNGITIPSGHNLKSITLKDSGAVSSVGYLPTAPSPYPPLRNCL